MATIKELLSAMIDKINGNEDKIDNIKGVPEAFDSITMTNGTDMANLTMSAEKELLFNGEAVGSGSGGVTVVYFEPDGLDNITANKTVAEIKDILMSGGAVLGNGHGETYIAGMTHDSDIEVIFYSLSFNVNKYNGDFGAYAKFDNCYASVICGTSDGQWLFTSRQLALNPLD